MTKDKLITHLKNMRHGFTDIHDLIGKIDASSLRTMIELYVTGINMLIEKLEKENVE